MIDTTRKSGMIFLVERMANTIKIKAGLTFDIEMEDIALCFSFTVGCRASVATGAVTADALQHQTLIRDDDANRNVVTELLFLRSV